MYGIVRALYEELYALHRDRQGKYAELKADHASLAELFGVVKRQAARAVGLESERDGLKALASRKDGEIRRLVAALRGHAKGRIAYPAGRTRRRPRPAREGAEEGKEREGEEREDRPGARGGRGRGAVRRGKAEEADSGRAGRQEGPHWARRVVRPERRDRHPQVSPEGGREPGPARMPMRPRRLPRRLRRRLESRGLADRPCRSRP